jgi:hypothetical protein
MDLWIIALSEGWQVYAHQVAYGLVSHSHADASQEGSKGLERHGRNRPEQPARTAQRMPRAGAEVGSQWFGRADGGPGRHEVDVALQERPADEDGCEGAGPGQQARKHSLR